MSNIRHTIAIAFLAIAAGMLTTSCIFHVKKVDKHMVEKTVKVDKFNEIEIHATADVIYTVADSISVRIVGPAYYIPGLDVTTDDGVLKISFDYGDTDIKETIVRQSGEGTKIYVSGPSPEIIRSTSYGTFTCEDTIAIHSFHAEVLGVGDIRLTAVEADSTAMFYTNGTGDINVGSIKAERAYYSINGGGNINAKQSEIATTSLLVYGTGNINLTCKNCLEAKASIQGMGDINISGDIKNVERNVQGAGNIFINGKGQK